MTPMNNTLMLVLAALAGGLLGAVFFGGLWLTVNKGLLSKRPLLWLLASLIFRMSITLGGFYWVSDGQWQRLVACLVGFVCARQVGIWLSRVQVDFKQAQKEVNDAP